MRGGGVGLPGAVGFAHVHRIGVELRCNGDESGMTVPFSPFPLSGLMPEGQEPRSCSPSSRGAAGQRGARGQMEGITRPKGRRKIRLERTRIDPTRSDRRGAEALARERLRRCRCQRGIRFRAIRMDASAQIRALGPLCSNPCPAVSPRAVVSRLLLLRSMHSET